MSVNGGSDEVPTIVVGDCVLLEPSDTELTEAILNSQSSEEGGCQKQFPTG